MSRNEYMGQLIREKIGEVLEVDVEENELEWRKFMQVCVSINVFKPLLREKKINVRFDQPCWISFSYERLSNFYYHCGRLGHGYRDCIHKV